MKYQANYVANGSTRNAKPYTDTNLQRLIKDIREIAEGETFAGGCCSWHITDESEHIVASGGTNGGRRFRTK